MKRLMFWGTALAIFGMALIVMQSNAQIKKGKERPLQTRHLMNGLIVANNNALTKALQGSGPEDDKAWDTALQNAELLNESAHIMMADGRCPDKIWSDSTKMMQDGSAAVITALDKKDLEAAKAAHGSMMKSCGNCHKTHKK